MREVLWGAVTLLLLPLIVNQLSNRLDFIWSLWAAFIAGVIATILCIPAQFKDIGWRLEHPMAIILTAGLVCGLFGAGGAFLWISHDRKASREKQSETFLEPSTSASQRPLQVDVRISSVRFQERADVGGIIFVVEEVSIINREDRRIAITAELYVKLKAAPGSTIILQPHTGTLPKAFSLGIVPRFQPLSNIEPSTGASGTFVFIMERKTIDPKAWPNLSDWKQTPEISLSIIDRITQRERLFSTFEAMSGFQETP
jgi:hypothetical protein